MSDILDELDRIDALKAEADLVLLRERDVRHIPIITLPFGDEHEAKYALATMNAYPRLAAEIRRLRAEVEDYKDREDINNVFKIAEDSLQARLLLENQRMRDFLQHAHNYILGLGTPDAEEVARLIATALPRRALEEVEA